MCIYQVIANRDFKNQMFTDRNMAFPLGPALEKGYPQIKSAVEMSHPQRVVLEYGKTKLNKSGYTVSGTFFDIFTWKFLKGSAANAITAPSSIVLSESAAKAFFGNDEPINKVLKIDNSQSAKVSAIVPGANLAAVTKSINDVKKAHTPGDHISSYFPDEQMALVQ